MPSTACFVQGSSRTDIHRFAAEEWSISTRQADEYMREARDKLEQDCSISRQEFLAEAIVGLRSNSVPKLNNAVNIKSQSTLSAS